MPAFRIDWDTIQEVFSPGCVLVCLDPRMASALQSALVRFHWRATFEAWDWVDADWDELQLLVSETESALGNPMSCDEILAAINAVESAVYATACCDPVGTTVGAGDGSIGLVGGTGTQPTSDTDAINGPFPVTTGTDPDNSGSVTFEEFQDYLCSFADLLIDATLDVLQVWDAFIQGPNQAWLSWVNLTNKVVASVGSWLIPGFADNAFLYEYADWANNVNQNILDTGHQELQDAYTSIQGARQDLRCAMQDIATADSAAAAFKAILDALPIAASILSYLDNLPLVSIASLAWNGLFNVDWDADCSGCSQPLVAGMNVVGIVLTTDGTDSTPPIHCDITRNGSAVTLVGNPLSTTTAYGIHWARRSGIPMTTDRDPLTEWPGSAARAAFRITCIARDNVGDVFRWHCSDGSQFGVNLAPGESYLVYVNNALWSGYDWASEADTIDNLPSGDNNFDEQSCDVYTGRAAAPGGTAGGTWRIEQYWWLY